jgi:peroxiredoxin
MATYSAPCNATLSTTATVASLVGAGSGQKRSKTIEVFAGVDGTPGDTAVRLQFQRCTAAGTNTAVTVVSLDAADAAATCVAGRAHSAEPTYTASTVFFQMPFNQRSTVRWFAAPGEEFVTPATANNGYGILPAVAPSLSGYVTLVFQE